MPFVLATVTVGATVGLLVMLGKPPSHEELGPESVESNTPAAALPPSPESSAPAATNPDAPATLPTAAAPGGSSRNFELASDGTAVPMLGADAPSKVRIAVALFRYAGAEGAGSGARDRRAAEELARSAIEKTQADGRFDGAVALGDAGSTRDLGWVPRGILERRVEYAVFSLPVGGSLTEPLDTPRGFWVVRRLK